MDKGYEKFRNGVPKVIEQLLSPSVKPGKAHILLSLPSNRSPRSSAEACALGRASKQRLT